MEKPHCTVFSNKCKHFKDMELDDRGLVKTGGDISLICWCLTHTALKLKDFFKSTKVEFSSCRVMREKLLLPPSTVSVMP